MDSLWIPGPGGEAARPPAQQRGLERRGAPLRAGRGVAGSVAAAAAAGEGLGAWDCGRVWGPWGPWAPWGPWGLGGLGELGDLG